MTQLRNKMLEELQRRNYSHRTPTAYIRVVREFAEHFHESPDKLGLEHIRQYQAHLFQTKKLSPFTVSQYVSALRFLFVKTLRRHFQQPRLSTTSTRAGALVDAHHKNFAERISLSS